MAKASRGGKRTTIVQANSIRNQATLAGIGNQPTPTPVVPPTPAQVAQGNILPQGGIDFTKFETMTDDEKADVIEKSLGAPVPMFLDQSDLQKFAYFTGMKNKPDVVDDSVLDTMKGQEMFRTVHDAYNRQTDIGYSAKDITRQITEGDFTMYSDSGGSAYGKGIYFANNYYDSALYMQGNASKNLIMRAKFKDNAKVITAGQLTKQMSKDYNSGSKLAKVVMSKADGNSENGLYALAKGYDAIVNSNGYIVVLNRRCLAISKTTKQPDLKKGTW